MRRNILGVVRRKPFVVAIFSIMLMALCSAFFSRGAVSQAETSECKDLPSTKITKSAPISTEYKVWAYVKAETRDATPYVQINSGECENLDLPVGEDWEWVSSGSAGLITPLAAGDNEFTFSVKGSSVLIDKFLITSELECRPEGDGQNCIEFPLTFDVTGIAPGETVNGARNIGTEFVYADQKGIEVTYAFDDLPIESRQVSEPFCMVPGENDACGTFDLSSLGEGEHVLKVAVRSPAGQRQAKHIPFTVSTAESEAQPQQKQVVEDNSTNNLFKVNGIKNNDVLRGGRLINVTQLNTNAELSITYRLDGKVLVGREEAPFCLRNGAKENTCGEWDTTALKNGKHELVVLAPISKGKDIWESFTFTVDNQEVITTSEEQPDQMVMLGNGDQQATGMTRMNIPKDWVNQDSSFTFMVNSQVVGQSDGGVTFADVDTTKYVNGVYIFSATVKSTNGTEEVLSSRVEVKNNKLTSFSNWVRSNTLLAIGLLLLIVATVFALAFVVTRWLHHRKFIKSHKMSDYDKTTEEIIFKFFNNMPHLPKKYTRYSLLAGGVASVAVIAGVSVVLQLGRPLPVAGLGFVAELEDGSTSENSPFKLEHGGEEIFVRLGDGSKKLDGTEFTGGHANHGLGVDPDNEPAAQAPKPAPKPATGGSSSGGGGGGQQQVSGCTPGVGSLGSMGPCINANLIPGSVLGYSTSRLDSTTPITQNNGEPGAFRQRCDYSHMNFDDPVLYRNQPGAAHLHTYFGNTGANASSTSASLRSSGNSTCAGGTFNRSAYWIPSLIDTATGGPVRPRDERTLEYHSDLEIYYKLGYQGVGYEDVYPFPNGLQMIAGNAANATGPTSGSRVKYYCEDGNDPWSRFLGMTGSNTIPTNCARGDIIVMTVDFPQCWNGQLTSPNGRSHLAYGQWQPGENRYTRGCPTSHPRGIPSILMIVRWTVTAADSRNYRLSSDNYTSGPGGYSGHADYVFAWNETAFPTVKQRCYVAMMDCGYQLGDGRAPRWSRSR